MCSATPTGSMRLALLNTRAHNIFRPWFYRFSLGQRWAVCTCSRAIRAPTAAAPAASRCVCARTARWGCFDDALENEYLGWMDTARGRRTFVEFFTHYHVPAVPDSPQASGADRLPHSDRLGRSRSLHSVRDRGGAGRAHPRRDVDPAKRRSLHHGGATRRGDRGAAGTAGQAVRHFPRCGISPA